MLQLSMWTVSAIPLNILHAKVVLKALTIQSSLEILSRPMDRKY